ncbi:MAG: hypothetical protein ABIC18_03805 [Candidatus Omnitrophota bacterium]
MFAGLNERVKRLTIIDVKLIKLAVFFAAIIVVKLFPQLLRINFPLLILLVILCSARPFYKVWLKK